MKTHSYTQILHHSVVIVTCCKQLHPKETLWEFKFHRLILNPFVLAQARWLFFSLGIHLEAQSSQGWISHSPKDSIALSHTSHLSYHLLCPSSSWPLSSYLRGVWPPRDSGHNGGFPLWTPNPRCPCVVGNLGRD